MAKSQMLEGMLAALQRLRDDPSTAASMGDILSTGLRWDAES